MKSRILAVVTVAAVVGALAFAVVPGIAQEGREQALEKLLRAYEKAYLDRDATALAACFLEDAEFLSAKGTSLLGRAEIRDRAAEFFKSAPDGKITAEVARRRFTSPVSAIEDGIVTVYSKDGGVISRTAYTAFVAKEGDRWLYASLRDYAPPEPLVTSRERLQALAWLVGEWTQPGESGLRWSCRFSDEGPWLLQRFELVEDGEVVERSVQHIGWDPLLGRIRSWTFDSEGGHGGSLWTETADGWILRAQGVSEHGVVGTGTFQLTRIGKDSFEWAARDQVLGGQHLPDHVGIIYRKGREPK